MTNGQTNDKFTALLAWMLLGLACVPAAAVACSCMAFPRDEAKAAAIAYARADAVFLGEVSGIISSRLPFLAFRDTTFTVLEAWKGLEGQDPVVVRSARGEIACGFRFSKPAKYLVFAYWNADRGLYTTSLCDLTREASDAASLVRELTKIRERETK